MSSGNKLGMTLVVFRTSNLLRFRMTYTFLYFSLCLSGLVASVPNRKLNPDIVKSLQTRDRLNIFVSFEGTKETLAHLSPVLRGMSQGDSATAVYKSLVAHAERSQESTLVMLNSIGLFNSKFKSFWITNQIYIENANASLIHSLAALDDVRSIDEEIIITLDDPNRASTNVTRSTAWGIQKIQTHEAWAIGGTGKGVVVGIIDTGARFTHQAIRDSFRAGTHSWYDPYAESRTPYDIHGHGTHVTGTIAGKFGIGVAPGANWISCKGFDENGYATEASLVACGEFMACPHDYLGDKRDCSLAPQVVSNSWGANTGGLTFYDAVIDGWHAAKIIPVFSAGNDGPTCSTVRSPSDSRSSVISVGATDITDAIACFSSRGPSTHAKEHKPDISAPGVDIFSAGVFNDSAYSTSSGTSMACPHVAGLVAILKGISPKANYDRIRTTLANAASKNMTFGNGACGGVPEYIFPNFPFGHGRINAFASVKAISS